MKQEIVSISKMKKIMERYEFLTKSLADIEKLVTILSKTTITIKGSDGGFNGEFIVGDIHLCKEKDIESILLYLKNSLSKERLEIIMTLKGFNIYLEV